MEDHSVNRHIPSEKETNTELTDRKANKTHKRHSQLIPVTFSELNKIAFLRYGSTEAFSKKLGVSRSRASQILNGLDVPVKSESIKKIAKLLNVDVVILTQLFAKEREE